MKISHRLGDAISNFKKGKNNIVIIDEFLGSGKTLLSRHKWLKNELKDACCIKVVYLAAIEYYADKIKKEGIDIYCTLLLKRGISDNHEQSKADELKKLMQKIESGILKSEINKKKLEDYSLGFNKAEALYSAENCGGNTPNSVFPIFWWSKLKDNSDNLTLLTRYEEGF